MSQGFFENKVSYFCCVYFTDGKAINRFDEFCNEIERFHIKRNKVPIILIFVDFNLQIFGLQDVNQIPIYRDKFRHMLLLFLQFCNLKKVNGVKNHMGKTLTWLLLSWRVFM